MYNVAKKKDGYLVYYTGNGFGSLYDAVEFDNILEAYLYALFTWGFVVKKWYR